MFRTDLFRPDTVLTAELAEHYRRYHQVAFPGFVYPTFFAELKNDVDTLLQRSRRRDFLMECMDNSPRRMNVFNGNTVELFSRCIPAIYNALEVLDFSASNFIDLQSTPIGMSTMTRVRPYT